MSKQDKTYTRTASELERKHNFDKKFSEIMGLISDSRDKVDSVESELRNTITEQITTIARDTEQIIMSALESRVSESELEEVRSTLQSELSVMAEQISLNFTSTTTQLTNVEGNLKTVTDELDKHFDFSVNGLTIRAGEGSMTLVLDNDVIKFVKNGEQFGWWDGVNFHTGNIVINLEERAQIGNFAFVPRSNGSLDFLKVGG